MGKFPCHIIMSYCWMIHLQLKVTLRDIGTFPHYAFVFLFKFLFNLLTFLYENFYVEKIDEFNLRSGNFLFNSRKIMTF